MTRRRKIDKRLSPTLLIFTVAWGHNERPDSLSLAGVDESGRGEILTGGRLSGNSIGIYTPKRFPDRIVFDSPALRL
jgi:hypothetical protein